MKGDYQNAGNPYVLERPDEWSGTYVGPSNQPGVYRVHGYVCRGMSDEAHALQYARVVADFFSHSGLANPVFVVRGPTSTNRRAAFEVTDACSTYKVVARVEPVPQTAPAPGMPLRAAVVQYGLEALRGVPIDDGTGEVVYIHDRCIDGDLATWADAPSEAFRITRFYGGESPQAAMVRWIYVGGARIAEAPVQQEREAVRERGC